MTDVTSEPIAFCELGVDNYLEILDLWRRAGLPARPEGRDAPDAFARQMASGLQNAIGIRVGGALVAVAVLTHDGRKGWINRLAVDPAHRRRGLAHRLIAEAERWFADEKGLAVFAVLVEMHNQASLALFEGAGYRPYDVTYLSKRTRSSA